MLAMSEPGSVPEEPCSRCGGVGWVFEADSGVGRARRCRCRESRRIPALVAAAGIPRRYTRCCLERFQVSHPDPRIKAQLQAALVTSRRYVDSFLEPGEGIRESGLLFVGPPGVGKTHLAVAVLVALIERYGVRGRFINLTSLVHQLQSTFDRGAVESKAGIIEPVLEAEVLVLDELGAQKPTAWVQDLLYLIIDGRYNDRRPTIFTTNFRLQESASAPAEGAPVRLDRGADPEPESPAHGRLSHRLPALLVSRLAEMASPVRLDAAPDYRSTVLVHRHRI